MAYAQPRIHPGEWDAQLLWDSEIQMARLIPARCRNQVIKKEFGELWTLLSWQTTKQNWKKTKRIYLDLSRELKNRWNMKVTVLPIVIGILGILDTVKKGLMQGLEDLEKKRTRRDHPNYSIVKSARLLRRDLDTWGDLLSLKLQW